MDVYAMISIYGVDVCRRGAHISGYEYEKNIDDQVSPSVVPDDVIQAQSDKYWAPHPHTGVFVPATENKDRAGGEGGGFQAPPANGGNSVLDQKFWFRYLEDVEKPQQF
uniref:Uncharacterized protein n=1 Tax=Nelumbo nucifera TaxID=4432 RepID=A0A822YV93_NELNU|nr:TPA_asm: hypothetical protein HUJ06_007118 [Nelumbo nucifera]